MAVSLVFVASMQKYYDQPYTLFPRTISIGKSDIYRSMSGQRQISTHQDIKKE